MKAKDEMVRIGVEVLNVSAKLALILSRLSKSLGISGTALDWLASYLCNRSEQLLLLGLLIGLILPCVLLMSHSS